MPVQFRDYYQTLGVSKTASEAEIKTAFRKLARQHHPDVSQNKDKAKAEEKFKEINEAYEVLGDPEKRRRYDQLGANWNQAGGTPPPHRSRGGASHPFGSGGPGAGGFGNGGNADFEFNFGGTGFSDFFEAFFGPQGRTAGNGGNGGGFDPNGMRRGRGMQGEVSQRGEDIEGDLMVTLEESLRGIVRPISMRRTNPRTGVSDTQTFQVRVPAGIREGQRIRLAGQGEAGAGQGGAGDLFLRVRFAKHPDFRVEGDDLYQNLDLAPWEAILGTTIELRTLEGSVSLRIPAGATAGQNLRLRGQGLMRKEGGRGDLYAEVMIQVPSQVGESERKLWEQLAQTSSFQPRA